MKATMEKLEKNTVVLNIEVEPDKVQAAMDQAFKKLVRTAKVPGFRPGKVPRVIFERYYGKQPILEEAFERLVPETYVEAVRELAIEPIGQPEFDIVKMEEGEPLLLKAKVEVKPEVVLGEYKGLEITKPVPEVAEDDVARELEKLQNRYAKLVTVDDGEVQKGDIVTIDYEGTVDGKPFPGSSASDRTVEAGMGFLSKEIDDILPGMKIGETRETTMRLPENYHASEVAGKEATIKVTVKGIKRKEVAPLDDEFAKDVSEFDTLEELKANTREKLQKEAEERAEAAVRNGLLEKAVANAEVEVPGVMVERQAESLLDEQLSPIRDQGLTAEDYFRLTNSSRERMLEDLRPQAEFSVKAELVLDAIGKAEGLTADEDEVDKEIETLAQYYRQDKGELKKALEERGALDGIRRTLVRQKAVQFLVDNANIKEVKELPVVAP